MLSLGLVFWILVIVGLVFGVYRNRDSFGVWAGDGLLYWVLIILLGLAVFGSPFRG